MIVVFAGPTISHAEITSLMDCRCLPPVSHGDIVKLDLERVTAIGIIDGYFEGVPSVWHKEILYAMSQGVHVYGTSSMGALRAAELNAFGMQGVGQIFEWYRDLVIEDDDEVAVLHGPEEAGFLVASEPMVNIRCTLQLALKGGVITSEDHDLLIALAKSTFYKKRSWNTLLGESRWEALAAWVKQHKIDLKKADAISLLHRMQSDQTVLEQPFKANFVFEWTNVWDAAFRFIRGTNSLAELSASDHQVLSQLKLSPDQYHLIASRALASWVERYPSRIEPGAKSHEALKDFREKNGLMTRAALLAYMDKMGVSEADLEIQMEEAGRLLQAKEMAGDLSVPILEKLRQDGAYQKLLTAAEKKKWVLECAGLGLDSARVRRGTYFLWYFEQMLGIQVPLDLDRYIAKNGFRDMEDFDQVVIEEYLYRQCSQCG